VIGPARVCRWVCSVAPILNARDAHRSFYGKFKAPVKVFYLTDHE
jgi:hypothetical protein